LYGDVLAQKDRRKGNETSCNLPRTPHNCNLVLGYYCLIGRHQVAYLPSSEFYSTSYVNSPDLCLPPSRSCYHLSLSPPPSRRLPSLFFLLSIFPLFFPSFISFGARRWVIHYFSTVLARVVDREHTYQ
ncbi:uncharacterized protein LDX57_000744, partial [Aspergillus melleus]|uniref:uncharacterized protein n=1 Tax=Aspergillus melleus TaxID=138277 RepID=UPI001E8EA1B4